jgi:tetratricopeptide (TPR) repeat protein
MIKNRVHRFYPELIFLYFMANMLSDKYVTYAQKGLIYDPEKGIIFEGEPNILPPPKKSTTETTTPKKASVRPLIKKPSTDTDFHIGRQKDPPEVYFKSGLEYFKNNDFENALKNFEYADSVGGLPLYKLWRSKILRRIGATDDMLNQLDVIIKKFSSSDIADDALLELAVYYKSINEYEMASQTLTQLIEQYPFGISASSGEELSGIARDQRKLIRAEMLNLLSILGIKKEDLSAGYKQFQKENGLPVTGTGTRETVSLIKNMHTQLMKQENRALESKTELAQYQHFTAITIAGLLVSLFTCMIMHRRISNKQKLLVELKKALGELDTKKI